MSITTNTAPTWADLNDLERPKLIHAAIDGSVRILIGSPHFSRLTDQGLLDIEKKGQTFVRCTLSQAGRDVVLSCPNDYERQFFPSVADVQAAKAAVRRIDNGARQ